MTIFFPDLSHYDMDRGLTIEDGTIAVIIKATHGTLFLDRGYEYYRSQALNKGAYFVAYHWLNHGNGRGQAEYCYRMIGAQPVMIDAEDTPANDGYNGPNTVQDIIDFALRYRELGGRCNLAYIPRWYWEGAMNGENLESLIAHDIKVVASNYTTYSDNGPGWNAYGGVEPIQWQYTSNLPYGGSTCDFNAFKGTLEEYKALVEGSDRDMTPDQERKLNNIERVVTACLVDGNPIAWGLDYGQGPSDRSCWTVNKLESSTAAPTITLTDADRTAIIDGVVNELLTKLNLVQRS